MTLERLLSTLEHDPWRDQNAFSTDVHEANALLFAATNDTARSQHLLDWIGEHQPCIFGRVAARKGALAVCVLTEHDLSKGDTYVRDKIQSSRTAWKAAALTGVQSGFIISVLSPTISVAKPTEQVLAFARELASLYLLVPVMADTICLDSVRLEQPTGAKPTWEWSVGANYFCAQGDRRWWHDHRVPGGMALSMNSVGHMVKSRKLAAALEELAESMGTTPDPGSELKIDSLGKALIVAMETIDRAQSITASGRATELLPLPDEGREGLPRCPVDLPNRLAGYNHCSYRGRYHTDQTLPRVYFRPDVERPADVPPHELDLTYLFDDSIENPAFSTMGAGVRVRIEGDAESQEMSALADRLRKVLKAHGRPLS